MKAYGKIWDEFEDEGLNKPGTVVRYEYGGEIRTELIGDINESRGVCDDCTEISHDQIIDAYDDTLCEHLRNIRNAA